MNIGNPNEFTIRELADIVVEVTGSSSEVRRVPLPTDDPKVRRPDITRARGTLGWEPGVELKVGLEATIEYFMKLQNEGGLVSPPVLTEEDDGAAEG